uniref:Transport and Golgi organization protein n=1 Tax=Ananas comosus var. bracteatus TaxID=296719 RepID=A0A6V7PJB3_ANACO|nr:unnamed protein product [Ananas comosus var. bracteatus]
MGVTKDGRLAFLTNVLEPDSIPDAKTRGDLPLRFLQSKKSPATVAKEIAKEAENYNGFNLILADLRANVMVYVSNRPQGEAAAVQIVPPGLHVLSNAKLDSPWPKAQRLGTKFREFLWEHGEEETIEQKEMAERLMKDTTKADKDQLPNTGCDANWELNLSPVFVEIDTKQGRYGTRSTAVLSVTANGDVSFYEKYLEGGVWKDHTVEYHIEKI